MLPRIQKRKTPRAGIVPCVLLLTLLAHGTVDAQFCACAQTRPFGSCVNDDLALGNPYPGRFPGPAAVVARPGLVPSVFIADLFGGVTYRYRGPNLADMPPETFPSPRGSQTVSGLAYHPGQDRLYWAIGGEVVDTIVVTEADPPFAAAEPFELEIDLAALAEALFGDPGSAGSLGDITYHPHRDTLWAVDIVNDVYFEIGLDGELVRDDQNVPVHFFNPEVSELSSKAFGNSLTYAEDANGRFFDLLVGTSRDGRPTRVVRLAAEEDTGAGTTIGSGTGVSYPLFTGLIAEEAPGAAFPTAIAHWPDACGQGQSSEMIMVFDAAGSGEASTAVQVSADAPDVSNIADFMCTPTTSAAIRLTWRNTGYQSLEIFRTNLTEDSDEVMVFSTTGAEDPGEFLDAALGRNIDGTYTYRAVTTNGGLPAPAVFCTTTIGRGSLLGVEALPNPTGGSAADTVPFAITRAEREPPANDELVVVDVNTGFAQRLDATTLEPVGAIAGPFSQSGGRTTGIAAAGNRLFWLGQVEQTPLLQSTDLTGAFPDLARVVPFPPDFVRSPDFGDLAWDAVRDWFWVVDRRHNALFAIRLEDAPGDGMRLVVVPDSVIFNPVLGGTLGGGIAVADADATSVTLDIVTGPGGTASTVVRNRYELTDRTNPEALHVILASQITRAALLGGIEGGQRTRDDETVSVLFVVGSDTRRLYTLLADELSGVGIPFRRGDANNDGRINISDPSFLLNWLFRSGAEPPCLDAADVDNSDQVVVTDAVVLFEYLFQGGSEPPVPGTVCGFEPGESEEPGCEDSICTGAG